MSDSTRAAISSATDTGCMNAREPIANGYRARRYVTSRPR